MSDDRRVLAHTSSGTGGFGHLGRKAALFPGGSRVFAPETNIRSAWLEAEELEVGDMSKAVREKEERATTVLLANGHRLLRQGLKEMLLSDGRVKVVGEAENYDEAVTLAQEAKPDVVVLDAEEPVAGAWRTVERILAVSPPPGVVVVAVQGDNSYRPVWELLTRGASAYLDKHASPEDLIAAVHMASRGPREGNSFLAVPRATLARIEQEAKDGISRRELEVLRLAARGLSNRQIAHHLRLSEATIKRHLANLYPKMGVRSRGEATRKALELGWVSLRDVAQDEQDSSGG